MKAIATIEAAVEPKDLKALEQYLNECMQQFGAGVFTVSVKTDDGLGPVDAKYVKAFRHVAPAHNVPDSALGQTFQQGGRLFKLVGAKSGGWKYPFVAKRVPDGRLFKFSAYIIRQHFPHPNLVQQ